MGLFGHFLSEYARKSQQIPMFISTRLLKLFVTIFFKTKYFCYHYANKSFLKHLFHKVPLGFHFWTFIFVHFLEKFDKLVSIKAE